MHKHAIYFSLLLVLTQIACCQSNKMQPIFNKNQCLENQLKTVEQSNLYKQVMTKFKDTFELLKNQKEYFGDPDQVENKIDDALFFKKDSSECLLIVLQKMKDTTYAFATARIVRGIKNNDNWSFSISMQYMYGKDYFGLFKENNFENISKLARWSVLTDGQGLKNECRIDEDYWFNQLKDQP